LDANDLLYAVNASRNYDPSSQLDKIKAPVMYINSADGLINPPELGMAEREIKKVKNARFVLIPISDETRGHGTHTKAVVWKQYLTELLENQRTEKTAQLVGGGLAGADFLPASWALVGLQNLLAQANGFRRDFHVLVVGDELDGLLKTQLAVRNQADRFVGAGGAHVGLPFFPSLR